MIGDEFMRKIKNGFTLVETLGVLILLGIIALITIPIMKNVLTESKQELYDEQIKQIENGLKNWAHANVFLLPEAGDTIKLSLGQLSQTGYIDYAIQNPKTNDCFANESILAISKKNNTYIYKVEKILDADCKLVEESPTITLNGSVVEYLNVGDTYTELEATAVWKNSSGTMQPVSVTVTTSGSGTSVDTSSAGTYTITYNATIQGRVMTAIRTIIVK